MSRQKMTPDEIQERLQERCNGCGGTMQYMPSWHVDERDAVECMMCQRSNSEPITIAELQRKLPKYTGPKLLKGRPPGNFDRPKAQKDADYKKLLDAIANKTEPFIVRDLAQEMGKSSGMVAAWLRRAKGDGFARITGKNSVEAVTWEKHCMVAVWEALPAQKKVG